MGYRDVGGIRKDKLKNRDKDQVYRARVKKRLDKAKPDGWASGFTERARTKLTQPLMAV